MDGAGVGTVACMHRCTQWGLVRQLHAAGASAQMLQLWGLVRQLHAAGASAQMLQLWALRAARGMQSAMAAAACLVPLLSAPVSLGWTG